MGIFFKSIPSPAPLAALPTAVPPSLEPPLAAPSSLESAELSLETLNAEPTVRLKAAIAPSGQLRWGRLFFAISLLSLIFCAGIWTALNNLEDWSKVLLHSFELVLGLILGILGGEAAARH